MILFHKLWFLNKLLHFNGLLHIGFISNYHSTVAEHYLSVLPEEGQEADILEQLRDTCTIY